MSNKILTLQTVAGLCAGLGAVSCFFDFPLQSSVSSPHSPADQSGAVRTIVVP